MDKKITIAIDGPAGAGKSTVAKTVSQRLGITYIDTGAMYRAIALKIIRSGVNLKDAEGLRRLMDAVSIEICHSQSGEQSVILDGEDVNGLIRTHEISAAASNIATIAEIREKMTHLQRQIASKNSIVMDGRDIGTVVLPNADFKFYLTASLEERAKRRYLEGVATSKARRVSVEQIAKDIEFRDKNDSTRKIAPLSKATDAIEIDTTDMSIDDVVNCVLGYVKNAEEN